MKKDVPPPKIDENKKEGEGGDTEMKKEDQPTE